MEANNYLELEIDRFPQNDPNAIIKYGVPLMHYYRRDVDSIRKKCLNDETLDYNKELQHLRDRYLFKGTKRNNDEYDIVGNYERFFADKCFI